MRHWIGGFELDYFWDRVLKIFTSSFLLFYSYLSDSFRGNTQPLCLLTLIRNEDCLTGRSPSFYSCFILASVLTFSSI